MRLVKWLILSFGLFGLNAYAIDIHNPEVKSYIEKIAKEKNLNQSQLGQELAKAKFNPEVLQKIYEPANKNDWYNYKNILTAEKLNAGVRFWQQHEKELNAANQKYGIPPEIIVAIIGLESNYGQKKFNYRVIDSLSTLAFAPSNLSPANKDYFKKELTDYLVLTNKYNMDVTKVYGTYAGAIGIAHFMPSSYLRFAVDFNQDGKIDLNDPADAIGGIAAYMGWRGWKANQPLAIAAKITGADYKTQGINALQHWLTIKQWEQKGVVPTKSYPDALKASLVELDEPNVEKYWLVFDNFNTLYQYNPNVHFAIAVHRLAEEIVQAKHHSASS